MTKTTEKRVKTRAPAFKKVLHRIVRQLADTPLPEIFFISTFILIRWWNNSDFSYPSEIFIPLIAFAFLATIVFYIFRVILGKGLAAHVSALTLLYLLYIFQFVEGTRFGKFVYAILPNSFATPFNRSLTLAIILAGICGGGGWLVKKADAKFIKIRQLQLYKVLLFAILFIFSIQLIRTTQRIWDIKDQLAYKIEASAELKPISTHVEKRPDIYYIVFDRYTSDEVLKNNFNYDNKGVSDYLKSEGFVAREDARSNYPFTMSSISSTLALRYFPELETKFADDGNWQSAAPYRSVLNDPPLAQTLKQYGYQYNQVSSWWDFTRVGIKADSHPSDSFRLRVINKSFYLSDLQRDIFFKSILSPWLKAGVSIGSTALVKYDLDRNPRENFDAQFESLEKIASRADKNTPQFSFAHVLAPHPPYVFDKNGNHPSYNVESNDSGVDEKIKYINELTYVNKRLKNLVAQIRKNSPEAVIVIQADEGPYPKQFRGSLSVNRFYNPLDLPQPEMRQKFGVQAQYLMPGIPAEEVKKIDSSVNVFRFVLNRYFNYDLPMLPNCQLSSGNKFKIFNFEIVNDRLTGQANPADCQKYD